MGTFDTGAKGWLDRDPTGWAASLIRAAGLKLLTPESAHTQLTGRYTEVDEASEEIFSWRYWVVRVWEQSFESLLEAGPARMPFALLTNEARVRPQECAARLVERVRTTVPDTDARQALLETTSFLCGVRYDAEEIRQMFGNLREILMESSLVVEAREQGIVIGEARGEARGGQNAVLDTLTERFGPPPPEVEAFVRSITDPDWLRRLLRASISAADPAALLAVE